MKSPVASTRNKEHTPASFCKESDDVKFLNPAFNGNARFAFFCNAVDNLVLQKEFDLSTTIRTTNKLAEHLLENKALTLCSLIWAKLAVNQSQIYPAQKNLWAFDC